MVKGYLVFFGINLLTQGIPYNARVKWGILSIDRR